MSNVKLVDIKPKVNSDVVGILEDLLERAKSGEIHGIAVAAELSDRMSANVFHVHHPVLMLGELSILQRDLMDDRIDLRCPVNESEDHE